MNRKKIPLVTFILIAVNLLVFLYEILAKVRFVTAQYGMYQGALRYGQEFRLITSGFVHFDLGHLLSNMACLFLFGISMEKNVGSWKFFLIYMVSLIGGGLLINFMGGRGIHAGASGAVWGLMGADLVYDLKHHRNPAGTLRCIILNLVYSFSAGVSWQGHIGGGIAGALMALVLLKSFKKPDCYDPWYPGNGNDPYHPY